MTQMKSMPRSPLKNQKGFLTLDFIFAIILMFAFTAVLFAFSLTFTAVGVAQYATFAASRAYFSAHKTSDEQESAGSRKFNDLVNAPRAPLSSLFKNGWFALSAVRFDNFNEQFGAQADSDQDTFVGAQTTLTAKILQFRMPLLGTTSDQDLSAIIGSYLMREPTEEECSSFATERFTHLLNLDARFRSGYISEAAYAVMMDDGC